MKTYLLLRNNRESGPYSIEELATMKLMPRDLVWKEKESLAWSYPAEIEELKSLVIAEEEMASHSMRTPAGGYQKLLISIPSPNGRQAGTTYRNAAPDTGETEQIQAREARIIEEFREAYTERKTKKRGLWEPSIVLPANLASLLLVVASAVAGAFVVKRIVDHSDDPSPAPIVQAMMPIENNLEYAEEGNYQNAVTKEIIPPVRTANDSKEHNKKPVDLREMVRVRANEYKTGVLGGIHNLELTVWNGSTAHVDKVVVAVNYLKSNGDVLATKYYTANSLKPYQSNTIAVPAFNRGVKVQYKVISITSKQVKKLSSQV
jgi:hypothetical protein